MRLKLSKNKAEEVLINLLMEGYSIRQKVDTNYSINFKNREFENNRISINNEINTWNKKVYKDLQNIFPTLLQCYYFNSPPEEGSVIGKLNGDAGWDNMVSFMLKKINALHRFLEIDIKQYTDLPIGKRLYIEDIDSFKNVRDINPSLVDCVLENGYFDKSEDEVQMVFEQIINESFHKKDWGGEENDLYTSNILINGRRTSSAFLLKGNGLRNKTMEIKNCGKNGDQIIRLLQAPAELFIIQFVGNISENVIKDIEGKINEKNLKGQNAYYCIINGQDTARIFKAYNKL
ncbi:hypothetical protein B0A58_06560 [Flavobacterium branchiophilum NBRC 15030 = ATCC 35035]|uniref:Uncharacterized protein n=1 Tax=Flavobacterium branchiophilum TaxID=55197 RepID=A0A543G810_9FLAO|nr:hypothetical protein [Flavobacterium branchiophilum]OXA76916.1 hypothetical protein B0A58_06560 [Flavobacterium branchiophilum NBRC 15030 = ATCC 35035]TQM42226.1 hypothetical protein BC670_3266 [Flavobacterium branchiophilum]GEM54322.1 hypothetical protein FB1_05430 [Flavobacterium branchiophilum NBRC 15030 = ATCC 35035]